MKLKSYPCSQKQTLSVEPNTWITQLPFWLASWVTLDPFLFGINDLACFSQILQINMPAEF